MKRNKRSKFIEELKLVPIVSSVCEKLGISRNTVYRWRREDEGFRKGMDIALSIGTDSINDLAESKLINHIKQGQPWAIKFYLNGHKKEYTQPRPKSFWDEIATKQKNIDKFSVQIVQGLTDEDREKLERIKQYEEKFGILDPTRDQFSGGLTFMDMSGNHHPIEDLKTMDEKDYVFHSKEEIEAARKNSTVEGS